MSFSLTSVSPALAWNRGGTLIEITGTFELDHAYNIYIGPLGSVNDPKCHSGLAGSAHDIYAWSTTKIKAYTPQVDAATGLDIYVVDTGTSENHTLAASFDVYPEEFYTKVFHIRQLFPAIFWVGPRGIDLID